MDQRSASPPAPASPLTSTGLTRRRFTTAMAWGTLGFGMAAPLLTSRPAGAAPSWPAPKAVLDESPFVYISPLKSDGSESTCHGELWYAWLDDTVVVTVAVDRWKSTAIGRGLDRARIWVGDQGRWKTWYGGTNDDFRKAHRFDARGEKVKDDALFERLIARYETKYPEEIADWRDGMRRGNEDGSRVLIRYTPQG